MKKVQQMSTMLPIGRSDDSSVCTTSFSPGARLITLSCHRTDFIIIIIIIFVHHHQLTYATLIGLLHDGINVSVEE